MRILHLAYEDYKQPGSGGGALRTFEVNRRLSGNHEITALFAAYPGVKARFEGGVRWEPLGISKGTKINRLSYFALVGPYLLKNAHNYDLVVEDFSAPFSTAFSPLFTRKPVVASVQWFFSKEMVEKYHLPFHLIERAGLPLYHDFIVLSEWLAKEIKNYRPKAKIEIVPSGVEDVAFSVLPGTPEYLLYVGRLDTQQKGLDLLFESVQNAKQLLGEGLPPLLIVGDGPEQGKLERLVQERKLTDAVRFCGRVEGIEKYRLMAHAFALLMPSRFETFGLVAIEAQAVGTPVIAYNVGPLAEVAGCGGGYLVEPFDTGAFARAIAELVKFTDKRSALQRKGLQWSTSFKWDQVAQHQEEHYLKAVLEHKKSR